MCVPFHVVNIFDEIDGQVDVFNELFLDTLSEHAPIKRIKIKSRPNPFITPEIKQLIKTCDSWQKKARKTNDKRQTPLKRFLRACPREHRAVVPHAVSPISMKLYQFKGSTPKLKKTNVWCSHCDGIQSITLRVCTHIFTSLVNVRRKYKSIWLTACQSTEANIRLCL